MFQIMVLLASSLAWWQEPGDEARPATVVVRVPAAAKVFVDDWQLSKQGEQRAFDTPPLEPGYVYYYTVRIELTRDGRLFRSSKRIPVRAGKTTTVEFGPPAPAKAELPSGNTGKVSGENTVFKLSPEEQQLLDLVNKERAQANVAPLRPNQKLFQAAREHSANMARQGILAHTLDEKGPSERLREIGYQGFNWGENIAYGMPAPAQAMQVWMNSPGHRANILSEDYSEIGLGIVASERGVRYYTQVFGRHPREFDANLLPGNPFKKN